MLLGIVAFFVSCTFLPGIAGAATTPRWAIMSVAVPLLLPKRIELTPGHVALLLFLAWSALSLTWAVDLYGGVSGLWELALFAGLFCIGSTLTNLRPVYIGMAAGLSLSSIAAIAQLYGWEGVSQYSVPAGLFINPNFMAECAVMVAVALIAERMWWWLPAVLPAALLSASRGALLAFLIAGALWTRSRVVIGLTLAGIVCGGILMAKDDYRISSVTERFDIWRDTIDGMTLKGHGIGSFYAIYPQHATRTNTYWSRPNHAHSDLLETAYEAGIFSILFAAVWACAVWSRADPSAWLGLIAFGVMGLFGFPLHNPATMFLAALMAGRLCSGWAAVGWPLARRGNLLRAGSEARAS